VARSAIRRTQAQRALLTVILVGSRLERREDGRSTWARLMGVASAERGWAVPGVALGRQPAVRRLVLRRSCQSGRGECPAGAVAPAPAEPGRP
jgi:hypothetical protein